MSTELNILPFDFIYDISWSLHFSGRVAVKYKQVEDLRITKLDNKDFAQASQERDTYVLRWILKDEVYQYFKDNNISIDLLVIRHIDFTNIDYDVPMEYPARPENIQSLTQSEIQSLKTKYLNAKITQRKEILRKKYSYFPLYCNISVEELIMIKLSLV